MNRSFLNFHIYAFTIENEKIWGKCQRTCTTTTRKSEGTYKSSGFQNPFKKGGIPLLMKALNRP